VQYSDATDPGFTDDQGEADLDLEWIGAVARNANIKYVYAHNSFDAVKYVVNNHNALSGPSVISMSFGICEPNAVGYYDYYENLAKTANTME